jgi:hypothetical protein
MKRIWIDVFIWAAYVVYAVVGLWVLYNEINRR